MILNSRNLSHLARLLAEHPELARTKMEHWCDHKRAEPLGYMAMLRFDHGRLGLPRELPGTGAIAKALIDAGAPVDGHQDDPETPLITAASYGDADVAKVLIEAGADLEATAAANAGGVAGGTALLHAAVFGMTDVLNLLVHAGAHVQGIEQAAAAGDITGWLTPDTPVQARIRALVMAADHQRLNVIDQLIAAGTPVDAVDEQWGRQALRVAAQHGRPTSLRRLLDHGADPNLRDPVHHRTPLDWCQPEHRYLDSPAHDEIDAILRPLTANGTARRSPHAGAATSGEPVRIQIRIEASELPGRDCGPSADLPGYRNIHVGVQRRDRRDELLDLHPGDAPSVIWTLECTAVPTLAAIDIKGPHIQGRPADRFIYLSWGTVDNDGVFTMFRRAKLMLDAVEPHTLEAAMHSGRLTARLRLTDTKGHPLCAAVRPPLIDWSAAPDD